MYLESLRENEQESVLEICLVDSRHLERVSVRTDGQY